MDLHKCMRTVHEIRGGNEFIVLKETMRIPWKIYPENYHRTIKNEKRKIGKAQRTRNEIHLSRIRRRRILHNRKFGGFGFSMPENCETNKNWKINSWVVARTNTSGNWGAPAPRAGFNLMESIATPRSSSAHSSNTRRNAIEEVY